MWNKRWLLSPAPDVETQRSPYSALYWQRSYRHWRPPAKPGVQHINNTSVSFVPKPSTEDTGLALREGRQIKSGKGGSWCTTWLCEILAEHDSGGIFTKGVQPSRKVTAKAAGERGGLGPRALSVGVDRWWTQIWLGKQTLLCSSVHGCNLYPLPHWYHIHSIWRERWVRTDKKQTPGSGMVKQSQSLKGVFTFFSFFLTMNCSEHLMVIEYDVI